MNVNDKTFKDNLLNDKNKTDINFDKNKNKEIANQLNFHFALSKIVKRSGLSGSGLSMPNLRARTYLLT